MLTRKEKIMFMLLKMVILVKRENLSKKFQRLQSFKVSKTSKFQSFKNFQKPFKKSQRAVKNAKTITGI